VHIINNLSTQEVKMRLGNGDCGLNHWTIEDQKTTRITPLRVTQASAGSQATATVRCIGRMCQGALAGGRTALRCLSLRHPPGAWGRARPSSPAGVATAVWCVRGQVPRGASRWRPALRCLSLRHPPGTRGRIRSSPPLGAVARQSTGARVAPLRACH
jgi:hypothetical protein